MAIAKGQSDIKSERNLVFLGFGEQIGVLKNAQFQKEIDLKAHLLDISSNSEIGKDERLTIEKPLIEELQNIEEQHIGIRRTVLIGLYSLWELSLRAIKDMKSAKNADAYSVVSKSRQRSIAWNYLNAIYSGNIPLTALEIDDSVRILRNHFVHGDLSIDNLNHLKRFSEVHPDTNLRISNNSCYFSNYDGLLNLLNFISRELNDAEQAVCNSANGSK